MERNSLGDFVLPLERSLDFMCLVGKASFRRRISQPDRLGDEGNVREERVVLVIVTVKRIGRRRVAQGTSGLRVYDFEMGISGLAAEFGTAKKTELPGQRMLCAPESDPKEVASKFGIPVMRGVVEAACPAGDKEKKHHGKQDQTKRIHDRILRQSNERAQHLLD
jgi:hypothetical protein